MRRFLAAQFAPVLRAWRNGYEAEVRRAAIAFFLLVFLAFGVCLAVPELRLGFSAYLQHLFQGMDLTDGAGNLSPLLLLANNLRACAVTMLYGLIPFVYPSVNKEMQEGLINTYKESGFFPEWASPGHRGCMVGNNSASVLVDAYMKGVKVDDIKTLYEGLLHGTENVHSEVSSTGRLGHEYYNKLGYVPYDVKINENAARTLEYAYDDWCIYKLAKELKRPKKEINLFAKRAMNYKNLFDKESKLMRGRNEDGTFQSPFSPLKWGDAFTEGNSWHYTWSVFHDPQGLIDLMGGKEMFVTMMDSVFAVPPVFDDSYYGQVIHEIREMTVMCRFYSPPAYPRFSGTSRNLSAA